MPNNLKRPAGFGLLFIVAILFKLLIASTGWWTLLLLPLAALGVYLLLKVDAAEEMSPSEYYGAVMDQIEERERTLNEKTSKQ